LILISEQMLRAASLGAGSADISSADAQRAALLDDIVRRYQAPLLRFLYGIVQDRELAADLCQETFLAAFRALPSMTSADSHLHGWLFTVALNRARMSLRRRRLLSWVPFIGTRHDRPRAELDLATRLALRDELSRVLDQLPLEQRACLVLHAEGFRYAEIASVLECSVGAVKLRLFRARRRCLELYASGQGEDA
jgi:RNA polymerase sigma-70 factor (ECF subfamily)